MEAIFFWSLGGLVALASLVVLAALSFQALATARDRRRFPHPGRLIDVGGHRLHLHCLGEGSPTVVLDAGLPGTSLSWSYVQPKVAQLARVARYDRAGLGWSEAGPEPRTTARIVEELRTLLRKAGLPGPYVVVGHSFGGFTARYWAARYPDEVAGVVLVDSIHPGEWLELSEERRRQLAAAVRRARRTARLARLGVVRFYLWRARRRRVGVKDHGGMLAAILKLPAEKRATVGAFWTQPKAFNAVAGQVEALAESAKQVKAAGTVGDIPLVVLSAANATPARHAEQEEAAQMSPLGKFVLAENSGHWIQIDRPELVVEAIREVVEAVRQAPAAQVRVLSKQEEAP